MRALLDLMPILKPVLPDPGVPFQLVHHDDVASALRAAVLGRGAPGIYNLAGDGELTIADLAGRWAGTRAAARRRRRRGGRVVARLPFLPDEATWIEALRRPTLMDTAKARPELGWRPRHDGHDTLREMVTAARESEPRRARRRGALRSVARHVAVPTARPGRRGRLLRRVDQIRTSRLHQMRLVARKDRLDQRDELEDLLDGPLRLDLAACERDRRVDQLEPEEVRGVGRHGHDDLRLELRRAEVDLSVLALQDLHGHLRVRIVQPVLHDRVRLLELGDEGVVVHEVDEHPADVAIDLLLVCEERNLTHSFWPRGLADQHIGRPLACLSNRDVRGTPSLCPTSSSR